MLTVHFHWTFSSNHKVLTARKTTPAPVERSGTAVTAAPAKRQHATFHHSKVVPVPKIATEAVSAKKVDIYGNQTHHTFHTLSPHKGHGHCKKCLSSFFTLNLETCEKIHCSSSSLCAYRARDSSTKLNVFFVRWRKKRLDNENATLAFGVSCTTGR